MTGLTDKIQNNFKNNFYVNKQKGFTLIELLLVVIIIGVLSGIILSVINVAGLRAKARDSQRSGDIDRIALALELYYQDNRKYPESVDVWTKVSGSSGALDPLEPQYISKMPVDPTNNCAAGSLCSCTNEEHGYYYTSTAGGAAFMLATYMEISTSNDQSPCSDLSNWSGGIACSGSDDVCYGVESPF